MVRAALKNPYAVVVGCLIVAILGFVGIARTPVDVFPDLHVPAVLVAVGYRGMPAQDMESSITRRLERMFMQADGIDHMESKSLVGIGMIKVYFRSDVDVNAAISQIISLAIADLRYLPKGTLPPLVVRFDATSMPVCQLTLDSESLSRTELFDVANYTVRGQLGNIPGVAAPPVFGGKIRQVMVYLDPVKLQAQGLSPMDVVGSLDAQNLVIPTGEAKIGDSTYAVETNSQLPTPEAFNGIPLRVKSGRTTFLRDVARAEDSHSLVANIVRVNGRHSVYIPILKQGGANTIRVVEAVKKAMKNFTDVPKSVKLGLVFDQSIYIRNAIDNLAHEGLLGAGLAGLMVLIFLGNFRSMASILVSVPLAVIASLGALYMTGETVNLMTLGGLALAVGPVVDCSIVVIENIARHLGLGKSPTRAALDGATEVARPVLVSTISTLIVFLPVVFLSGIGRYLFTPLGKSVAFAMAASYVFALTFVPIFCARFLTRAVAEAAEHTRFSRAFERFAHRYEAALASVLRKRRAVFAAVGAASVAILVGIAPRIGQEFFPSVDAGQFVLNIRTAPGMKVEKTEEYVDGIEKLVRAVVPAGQLDTIVSNIGVFRGFAAMYSPNSGQHEAFIEVKLTDEHSLRTPDAIARLRAAIVKSYPDVEFYFQSGGVVSAALDFGLPAPIDVQIMSEDLDASRAFAEKVRDAIERVPGTCDTLIAQSEDMPSLKIDLDRTKASALGLTQQDGEYNLITCLNSSVNIKPVVWIDPRTGNDYFVAAQYDEGDIGSLEDLMNVPIAGAGARRGLSMPLRSMATIQRSRSLVEATHYNIQRTIEVFTTPDGRDIGSVAHDIEHALAPLMASRPNNAHVQIRGEVASMRESFASFGGAIALAVILVYLVLVAQFRSLVAPLLIISAVPLGFMGVLVTLWLTGTTINVQTFLGVMMLVGIVVSNSILLVEFADRKMDEGLSPFDAAIASGRVRIRPILMTSIATMLGLLPMAFNLGTGGEANVPLARAVIGGLSVSTFLTLFIVPALYVTAKTIFPATGRAKTLEAELGEEPTAA